MAVSGGPHPRMPNGGTQTLRAARSETSPGKERAAHIEKSQTSRTSHRTLCRQRLAGLALHTQRKDCTRAPIVYDDVQAVAMTTRHALQAPAANSPLHTYSIERTTSSNPYAMRNVLHRFRLHENPSAVTSYNGTTYCGPSRWASSKNTLEAASAPEAATMAGEQMAASC